MRHWLLSAWLPTPCVFCGSSAGRDGVCCGCRGDLPGAGAARCPVCGIETPGTQVCGQCLRAPPAFDRTVAAASYAFPLDAAIVRLKYGKDLRLVTALGSLLGDAVCAEPRPHVIVPMPLSPARLRERGFNQAAELARAVAARLEVPLRLDATIRARHATPQAALPLAERAGNVRGAFVCNADLRGTHVAIVDDVMTTGASADELAGELRRAGAEQVVCWVLARTPRPG